MRFFSEYLNLMTAKIKKADPAMLDKAAKLITSANEKGGKVIIAGNGGSAAIASHISVDLTNGVKIRAVNFNEADLITCFANDYGYERWLEKALEYYADKNDLVILISSSGRSENIINAAIKAKELALPVITLSGFDADNPLRQMGDINLWLDSDVYNIVETVHNIWLSAIVDKIIDDTASEVTRVLRRKQMTMPIMALTEHLLKRADPDRILEE